jgi:exosome complex exonuclease DIS3/RRP44
MTSAEYFCSGSHAEPEYRHYGLASEIYTHFTSPIRRYADLLVHRQLAYAIAYEGQGSEIVDNDLRNKGKLERVCQNLNFRHRNAQHAGRASIEYYVGQALKARAERSPDAAIDVDGYVMRVFENGMVVFVPQFGIEGLVRLDDFRLKSGEARQRESKFDADAYQLTVFEKGHETEGVTVELFQQLKVRVSSEEKSGAREKGKRRVRIVMLSGP